MQTPAGAIEHITLVNELVNDASRNNKSLYLTALDLRDAFGSVPHKLIMHNMEKAGIPKDFVEVIQGMYEDCHTRMETSQDRSRHYEMKRG